MELNNELFLVKANEEYLNQVAEYRKEFLDANSSLDGCGPLKHCENPKEWLDKTNALLAPDTLPENWVVSTQFLCIRKSDNKLVGMIQVRHYFNDFLRDFGGNIGYSVRPSERRKGYAKWMLKNVLPYCKELNLGEVLVTCIDTNDASRKTILANNGDYESTVFEPAKGVELERYWIKL